MLNTLDGRFRASTLPQPAFSPVQCRARPALAPRYLRVVQGPAAAQRAANSAAAHSSGRAPGSAAPHRRPASPRVGRAAQAGLADEHARLELPEDPGDVADLPHGGVTRPPHRRRGAPPSPRCTAFPGSPTRPAEWNLRQRAGAHRTRRPLNAGRGQVAAIGWQQVVAATRRVEQPHVLWAASQTIRRDRW